MVPMVRLPANFTSGFGFVLNFYSKPKHCVTSCVLFNVRRAFIPSLRSSLPQQDSYGGLVFYKICAKMFSDFDDFGCTHTWTFQIS